TTPLQEPLNLMSDTNAARAAVANLGDFTTSPRVLLITAMAAVTGLISAVVALLLLRLIGLFTNLFFFQRVSTTLVSAAGNHLGLGIIAIPVLGALVIGVMARYGSERIRGHGIPEAIEAILLGGSRIDPKVALLKPISSAISIGSGGPFGAEGPIIMTGGAFGSIIAQFFRLSSTERRTLLVAGAAGGMAATFATPIAAVALAAELLLFEWKPRSLIPVAIASAVATAARHYLIGPGPLFPVLPHPAFVGPVALLACVACGILAGALSGLLTISVYGAEDFFHKLPIHWMWWPAIGGVVVGIGGYFYPRALGVGYDMIGALLQGHYTMQLIIGVLVVKSVIWVVSLGSGTSGGVLAPLLMMGGALGGLEAGFFPNEGAGFWPLVSMGAIMGGTMRSPFTGVLFALELTHDLNMLLPLLIAVVTAEAFTVLCLKRSILTEKLSRRGFHLTREYAIDPLEILFVRDVMREEGLMLAGAAEVQALAEMAHAHVEQTHIPVCDADQKLIGTVERATLRALLAEESSRPLEERVLEAARENQLKAGPHDPLRQVVYEMADHGQTWLPVTEPDGRVIGLVSLGDLLKARTRDLHEEQRRERLLGRRAAAALKALRVREAERLVAPEAEPAATEAERLPSS
ncbi:MAG TPA: chloride channel protein, partial [Oscillatoriaceae cyanobacterium]